MCLGFGAKRFDNNYISSTINSRNLESFLEEQSMAKPAITRHAKKRIENDKRTKLSPEEVLELSQSPSAFRQGQRALVYSEADDKSLIIVTARQRRVLVTVYDTSRLPSRIVDMLVRKRANQPFEFTPHSAATTFNQSEACELYLGTAKTRQGKLKINELFELCTCLDFTPHHFDLIETREFHEMVTDRVNHLAHMGELSGTQLKRLRCVGESEAYRHIFTFPVWISYELLGRRMPSP